MSFDLVLVRRFEAVCRLRSFSRAADELGLSHSAMTKSIRSLEESLNVRLLERTTRSLAPTPAGQRLLSRAPDLLAHSEDVIAAISANAVQLSIICGPVILDAICHQALLDFRVDHPDVHVALQVMAPALAVEQLVRQRVDLLLFHQNVVRDLEHRKSLIVRTIISEPYVVLFRRGHPMEGADASIGAMLGYDWVVPGFDNLFQEGLPRDQRDMLLNRSFPKYRIASLSACADMAECSDLLTVVPRSAAASLMANRKLESAPLPGKARFSVCAVTMADAPGSTHANGFIDAIARTAPLRTKSRAAQQ
jgi:DNA-binding transcriptional LysR family regulator